MVWNTQSLINSPIILKRTRYITVYTYIIAISKCESDLYRRDYSTHIRPSYIYRQRRSCQCILFNVDISNCKYVEGWQVTSSVGPVVIVCLFLLEMSSLNRKQQSQVGRSPYNMFARLHSQFEGVQHLLNCSGECGKLFLRSFMCRVSNERYCLIMFEIY